MEATWVQCYKYGDMGTVLIIFTNTDFVWIPSFP